MPSILRRSLQLSSPSPCVTFIVPEELKRTGSDEHHHLFDINAVQQITQLINPDFVLRVGDDVRVALFDQRQPFPVGEWPLDVPSPQSSDAHNVAEPCGLRADSRETLSASAQSSSGSTAAHGIRFIRIKSVENPRPGLSANQRAWLSNQLETAQEQEERVVVLHDEELSGRTNDSTVMGIDGWREFMTADRPVVVVCGHTHYWRVANDGLQVSLAVRSMRDQQVAKPGYLIGHLEGDDFAAIYRAAQDCGPAVMITHPRDQLLSIGPQNVVCPDDEIRVRIWSAAPLVQVTGVLDQELGFELRQAGDNLWTASLAESPLQRGVHTLRVVARSNDGLSNSHEVQFRFDPNCSKNC